MSGIVSNIPIFYQDLAPEFVVMKKPIKSGIVHYMNNGHIELRDRADGHIIREEEMTKGTINCLKAEFEEDEKRWEQTKKDCAKVRTLHERTICK